MGSQEPRQVSRVCEGATDAGRHDRACGAERTSHLVERKRCGQCFPKGSREARLTPAELYAICALRQRVFVVEQSCVYVDADGYDPPSRHLWAEREGVLHAYLRIVPAGVKFAEVSLGRVVTAPEARGAGLGRELVRRGLASVGAVPVRIGA